MEVLLVNLLLPILADDTTAVDSSSTGGLLGSSMLTFFLPLVLIFVLMYFMMIRPQKKKQKEEQQMRNSLRIGDEITTIGGVCGRVLNVKEDSLVIETGADRTKMTIRKWAIQTVDTVHEKPVANDNDDDDDDDDI